jgi:uncharacterized protein (TIGR03437 family)
MRLYVCLIPALLGALSFSVLASAPRADRIPTLPVIFEPATSDAAPSRYTAKGLGYDIDIRSRENTVAWKDSGTRVSLRTRFLHTRGDARLDPLDALPSHTNYFLGNSPRRWRTGVPNFGRLRVSNLYPGIDLVYHADQRALEYDFVLTPGADPQAIDFEVSGAESVRLDRSGDLVLVAFGDRVRWKAPHLYQELSGSRVPVPGGFVVDGRRIHFRVGAYDRSRALIIDPVLSYSTYLGGASNESSRSVALDSQGNIYIDGVSDSTTLGLPGGFQISNGGAGDAFIAKFNPSGKLVYLTYLGGSAIDIGTGLAVDASGNAYMAGMTLSPNFPVTKGAFQQTYAGSGGGACETSGDAFVAKLNPSGSALIYSTYLGGNQDDFGSALAIDAAGDAYVTGYTLSANFPVTTGVYQPAFAGSGGQHSKPVCNGLNQAIPQPWFVTGDAFVTKLNPTGTGLVFSTYLGGTLDDFGLSIALDSSDNVVVGGFTLSENFPVTSGALDGSFGGSEFQNMFFTSGDGFVTKLKADGTALVFSTYLGGSGDDLVSGVTSASDGTTWVTGFTSSQNFPVTSGAVQPTYGGYYTLPFLIEDLVGDAFATGINSTGTAVVYSTYLGGQNNDMGDAIAVDSTGLVYVAGSSDSPNFPVTSNAIQLKFAGDGGQAPYFDYGDGFVAVIDPTSGKLVYSSYFGGSQDDQFWGIALDGAGGVWAAGNTMSTNLPVSINAQQSAYAGYTASPAIKGDSMLVHFANLAQAQPALTGIENSASGASTAVSPGMIFTLYGTNMGPAMLAGASLTSTGTLATSQAGVTITFNGVAAPIVYVSATQAAGVVPFEVAGQSSVQVAVQYNGANSPPLTVPVVATSPGLYSANYSGSGPAVAYNQDNTLNSATNPAASGSIVVLYGTGVGQTTPAGVDGAVATPTLLPKPQAACTATVGGVAASVAYCGSVSGVVEGEFQVNLQLSPNVSSGSQPVVVQIGSAQSQANLTVFVK